MIDQQEIILRLFIAAILGGIIGINRERNTWTAGLRTHMLVALGSCLAMIVSAYAFGDILKHYPSVVLDPSRIAAQVISGIGFLGAGTIMFLHRENIVRGLTTAAGLWTVAAIGLAVGGGMYIASMGATLIAWIILSGIKVVERKIKYKRDLTWELKIRVSPDISMSEIKAITDKLNIKVKRFIRKKNGDNFEDKIIMHVNFKQNDVRIEQLMDNMNVIEGIHEVILGRSFK